MIVKKMDFYGFIVFLVKPKDFDPS